MDKETVRKFVSRTESLVKPKDVTAISFLGDFNRFFPKKMQRKNMEKGSETVPYMGFIVDPYCFFLAYEITDRAAAQAMLPRGYVLAEARFFKGEPARPMVVIGAFSARTSAFVGNRLEFYLIARREDSGRIAWVIADYETNTNSYDPKNLFCGYTGDPAAIATTPYGELLVDFTGKKSGKRFSLIAGLEGREWRELDRELWIEGNLCIDYGGELKVESSKPFSLIFDPYLMARAREVPPESLASLENSYLSGIIDGKKPIHAAFFPFGQHFIIKQDIDADAISNEADLNGRILEFVENPGFKTMSGDAIKKPLFLGMLASAILNYGIIILLLILLLSR
jgi:hypothetical protein